MYESSDSGRIKNGTSLIAVEYKDGVIIGTDSRIATDDGTIVNQLSSDKIFKINDTTFACGAGPSTAVLNLNRRMKFEMMQWEDYNSKRPTIQMVAYCFARSMYENKTSFDFIIAGWDEDFGGQAYSVNRGTCLRQSIALGGSGLNFMQGYVDSLSVDNFDENSASQVVKAALEVAIKRDFFSGGFLNICKINAKGGTRDFYKMNSEGTGYEKIEKKKNH